MKFLVWLLPVFLLSSACVTSAPSQFGVQPNQLAHIPARIAVLPCRVWPQSSLYVGQTAVTLNEDEIKVSCAELDKFVLAGFDGQPYMRGLSPAVVLQLLQKAGNKPVLDDLDKLWFRPGQTCQGCRSAVSYYREVVATRVDWRDWLNTLSRSTANSDAILLPLIPEAKSGPLDDRGLFYGQRAMSIVLLLIDTNNGDLIWAGQQTAEVRQPLPEKPKEGTAVPLPPPEELSKKLYLPELWKDFPGRQN